MAILMVLIGFLSAWFMMHGTITSCGQYHSSGTVWGCKFKGKGNGRYILMAVLGFALLIVWMIVMITHEDGADYLWLFMISFFAGIGFSFYTWILERNKCYASDHISSAIANVAFMPELEHYAAACHHFKLAENGIGFYDETNYCIGQIIFTDYRLGNIPNNQMTFACYALAQKFYGVFTCHIEDRNVGHSTSNDTTIVITERHYEYVRK